MRTESKTIRSMNYIPRKSTKRPCNRHIRCHFSQWQHRNKDNGTDNSIWQQHGSWPAGGEGLSCPEKQTRTDSTSDCNHLHLPCRELARKPIGDNNTRYALIVVILRLLLCDWDALLFRVMDTFVVWRRFKNCHVFRLMSGFLRKFSSVEPSCIHPRPFGFPRFS